MYKKIKNYIISDALSQTENVFDRVKIETLFSIILFHFFVYIVGSIPIFIGDYPILKIIQIIGFSFIIFITIALKVTKNYKIPGIVWMIGGVVYTTLVSLISHGTSSFISFGFLMLNISITFLILDRGLRIVNSIYYIIYLTITLSITYNYLPKVDFGLDLSREIEFLDQSNIYPIILAMLMLSYIIQVFVSSHKKAVDLIFNQQKTALEQKKIIQSKSNSINNSIEYAVEIQNSFLPQSGKFDNYFSGHFILLKPKDKLSGDFYWIYEKDHLIYFAVVDSTGSGISGAILSIISRNGLQKATQELKLTSPSAILDYLSHYIEKTVNIGGQKDGMDISLCAFNKQTKRLFYAGANCPIYLIRNGELTEFKSHQQPIGKYYDKAPFENTDIQLNHDDVLYLFTDGFADQFGGEKGKKLKYNAFKQLLISTHKADMNTQKENLFKAFNEWKGELEQLDDICLIGLKI